MSRNQLGVDPIPVSERTSRIAIDGGAVSSVTLEGEAARALLVLAHGAGAGMRHPFMESLARRLAARGIVTLRYQFPYMEAGAGRPDPPARLVGTVAAAVAAGRREFPDLPLFAGGKSLGGRMTSTAASEGVLAGVAGIVFFGFPLHAPGQAGTGRAEHLQRVECPMLFLQGDRDTLADLERLRPVCEQLGARAELHVIDDADHSFHVRKRSGRDDEQALDELAERTDVWMRSVVDRTAS